MMNKNPVRIQVHTNPCICRRDDYYYIALTGFREAFGILVYQSRDMEHWELCTHVPVGKNSCGPAGVPSEGAVLSPYLTYSREEDLFFIIYGVIQSIHDQSFTADTFIITARDVRGPWSRPELLPGAPAGIRPEIPEDDQQKKMRKDIHHMESQLRANEKTHNSYEQELREQECIRDGNLEGLYRSFAEVEMERVGTLSANRLRNSKNLSIAVLTLSCRSAIEGGLSPEAAFTMEDSFVQQVEELKSEKEILEFTRRAQAEYCLANRANAYSATANRIILSCRNLVSKRIYEKLSVQKIAESMDINAGYLSQLFSREEGMPLTDFIAREKIREAEKELIYSDKSINAIAASLCFSSQSHFGKVFKRWTGMTPKKYRALYAENKENENKMHKKNSG